MNTDWITERIGAIDALESSLKQGGSSASGFTDENLTTDLLPVLNTYRHDLNQLQFEIQRLRSILVSLHTTCEEALNGIEEDRA